MGYDIIILCVFYFLFLVSFNSYHPLAFVNNKRVCVETTIIFNNNNNMLSQRACARILFLFDGRENRPRNSQRPIELDNRIFGRNSDCINLDESFVRPFVEKAGFCLLSPVCGIFHGFSSTSRPFKSRIENNKSFVS